MWRTPLMIAGGIVVAAAVPYVVTNGYLFHLLIMAVIWSILATSLNLVLGYTGLLSLAHGAFFGLGAYTSALLVTKAGWNFWASIPPAMAVAALVGAMLGILTLRLAGHYFAISTLSFGIVVSLILEKWDDLTEGPRGISSIPAPTPITLFGLGQVQFESNVAKYYLAVATLGICLVFVWRLVHSPIGRALEAIRQNELLRPASASTWCSTNCSPSPSARQWRASLAFSTASTSPTSTRRMLGCGTVSMPSCTS